MEELDLSHLRSSGLRPDEEELDEENQPEASGEFFCLLIEALCCHNSLSQPLIDV